MRLQDKKVLVTQATEYMGPAVCELFSKEGAEVNTWESPVPYDDHFQPLADSAGDIDILISHQVQFSFIGHRIHGSIS